MARFIVLTLAAVLFAVAALPQKLPGLNDGYEHGDAPFLIEDGWKALFNGPDLGGWRPQDGKPSTWFTARGVIWDRFRPTVLRAVPIPGDRLINGPQGRTANLVTAEKFGDVELYLEFMVSKGSNSGVYLHGLYEIQVFDSYGSTEPPASSDCGGVYHQWIDNKGVGGSAPSRSVSRPPGQWQSFYIFFQAPRFDAAGKKTSNAKFVRVIHNGFSVQENVEVPGPTRAHMNHAEAPLNPLMLQGDHGPVAYRNIYIRPLRPFIER
jgi:hypothetical protein